MFRNTMNFVIDSPINAMAVSRDGLLAVAGRSLLKVYGLSHENQTFGNELFNLRSSNLKNLNFSNSDVTWCPLDNDILATAATNGAVVVWNLHHSNKSKIGVVFNDHKRTVNKVCFHSNDPNTLLSGSQDGCMKLFDLRKKEAATTFVSNSESVRDVQFSPHWTYHFASVQETGNVEIWDIRKPEKPECNFLAHDGPVFACEWHPNQESYKWLATGGRDKTIKVWDLSNRSKPVSVFNVHTITPVSKLKWRPDKDFHIGSCSLVVDFSVYVWDIKRPFVPFAIFGTRKDVTTGLAWKNSAFTFISSCKDGTIYKHRFEVDAYYPAEHYPPIGIDLNPFGDVAFSTTDFIYRHSQTLNNANNNNNNNQQTISSFNSANLNKIKSKTLFNNSNYQATNNAISSNLNTTIQNANIISQSNTYSSSLTQNIELQNYHLIDRDSKNNRIVGSPSNQHSQKFLINGLNNTSLSSIGPYSYNISVPISYKKTNESILADHFRCMISYMMLFTSKNFFGMPNDLTNEISMNYFIYSAKNYLLCDRLFEELCEHNAQVSISLQRYQIAQTWRIIRHMFSILGRHPTSSGGAGNNPSGGSLPNMPPINDALGISLQNTSDYKIKNENPSRHTSGGTRHFSGNNSATMINNVNHQLFAKDSRDSDEEENNDNLEVQNHLPSLKQETIPSNKFVVDFFDFQSNNVDADLEQRSSHFQRITDDNFYEYEMNCQDWELQRESILHRHNIAEYGIQMNELNANNPGDNSLITNYEGNSSISYEEDDELEFNATESPGFFNDNLQSLLLIKNPTSHLLWPFIDSVANMLNYYVDIGDVQTAVSIILVLGDRIKQITSIDKQTINIWFRSYISLLHRFRLWNISTRVIQLSTDSNIQGINQTSTSVLVYCALCCKSIRHGSVLCEKCHTQPSSCSICHVSVRGLYIWCQGCAHGGHLQHMLEWFKNNTLCPAGCGHQCEMC